MKNVPVRVMAPALLLAGAMAGPVAESSGCCMTTAPHAAAPRTSSSPRMLMSQTLYIQLGDVFQTDTPHDCACAIGLGSSNAPLPAGLTIGNMVQIGLLNTMTSAFDPIVPFNALMRLPSADAAWGAGPPSPDPDRIGSPMPGATWFGFGGLIAPVTRPTPGPNQMFVICVTLSAPGGFGGIPDMALPMQIGGGLGTPNFDPLFDPANPHTATYSNTFTFQVPSSGAGATALSMLGLMTMRRRRTRQES